MKKLNRILLVSVASIGFIGSLLPAIFSPKKVVAQSQFECYMITETGQRIDLSSICDTAKRIRSNRSQRVVKEEVSPASTNAINHVPIQVINDSLSGRYTNRRRIYSGISPYPYRVLPNLGQARNEFLSSLTGEYHYPQNRILGPISDPYFSGSPPIIYRYQR